MVETVNKTKLEGGMGAVKQAEAMPALCSSALASPSATECHAATHTLSMSYIEHH